MRERRHLRRTVELASLAMGLCLAAPGARAEAAFAIGKDFTGITVYGLSYDQATREDAVALALLNCRQQVAKCRVQVQFGKACFALAKQADGNGYLPHPAATLASAIREAKTLCERQLGSPCTIEERFCDKILEPDPGTE